MRDLAGLSSGAAGRPWWQAAAWLAFLGPLFFLSYGYANGYASRQQQVPSYVFGWERHLPFLDWTIVPYMSIDLFYAASLFLCTSRAELRVHALRLLAATLVSVGCFLLYPLRFSFDRPETHGLYGWLFNLLTGYDKPYNQAPSLHVSLLMILWVRYDRHTRGVVRALVHVWFALIGLSVLTTYQHHAIDVLTGAAVGVLCLYAIPEAPYRWRREGGSREGYGSQDAARRRALFWRYLVAAVLPAAGAVWAATAGGGWLVAAWLLPWPAAALALVAAAYAGLDVTVFQKHEGRVAWPARCLLGPYRLAAWLSSRAYTRRIEPYAEVFPGVCIGRVPGHAELRRGRFAAIVDLAAEFPASGLARRLRYTQVSILDLAVPTQLQLATAAAAIEQARRHGRTLVHCALGFSRSAMALAAWRIAHGDSVDEALARIRRVRPGIVIPAAGARALAAYRKSPGRVAAFALIRTAHDDAHFPAPAA